MITPTNGRIMWYHPMAQNDIAQHDGNVPLAAIVCQVWDDHMVNLVVIDSNGSHHARTYVPIAQDGSPYSAGPSPYAEWMPYQIGQAKKYST